MATWEPRRDRGDASPFAPPGGAVGGARAALMRSLAGMSYEEQLAAVRPRGPLPPLAAPGGAVQRQVAPSAAVGARTADLAEDPEQWSEARERALDTFQDMSVALQTGVENYREMLAQNDPPRDWAALLTIAEFLAETVLGRLGERLTSAVGANATKNLLTYAFRMVVKDAQAAARNGITALLGDTLSEASSDRIKRAFITAEADALADALANARNAFRGASGLPSNPSLTIAELDEVTEANSQFDGAAASALVYREVTVAWCNLLASVAEGVGADAEHSREQGVLRLVIEGRNDRPTAIQQAHLYGAGPAVREEMAGTTLDGWLGAENARGLTITVRTDAYGFRVSSEARHAMIVQDVIRERDVADEPEPCVYFAFSVLPHGTIQRDNVPDGGRRGSAEAGLWFLDHVTPRDILDGLRDLPLPAVEAI